MFLLHVRYINPVLALNILVRRFPLLWTDGRKSRTDESREYMDGRTDGRTSEWKDERISEKERTDAA